MKTLTEIQIIYIQNDLKSRQAASGYRQELLDHFCCMMETKLSEGYDFSTAYALALTDFSAQGFIELSIQSEVVKKKRRIVSTQFVGAIIAASIVIFVSGLGAQDRPDLSPIPNALISSSFGFRIDPLSHTKQHHQGIDLRSPEGTPIVASGNGLVLFAGVSEPAYGRQIIIQHDEHFETIYAHLSVIKVTTGQEIKKGDIIGLVGQTGRAKGPHLHYEVIKDGEFVDPVTYLSKTE